jgi:hypothetical protein
VLFSKSRRVRWSMLLDLFADLTNLRRVSQRV